MTVDKQKIKDKQNKNRRILNKRVNKIILNYTSQTKI